MVTAPEIREPEVIQPGVEVDLRLKAAAVDPHEKHPVEEIRAPQEADLRVAAIAEIDTEIGRDLLPCKGNAR